MRAGSRSAEAATQVLDDVLQAASTVSSRAARHAARRLIRHRRLADAEALLTTALAAFPNDADLHVQYALAAQLDGRLADAAERWQIACALRPERAASWCGLAACERGLGAPERAKAAIGEALARAPDDREILAEAARAHDCANEPERSVELWSRLAAGRRVDPVWRQHHAEALLRLDRIDEADAVVRLGLKLHPGNKHLIAAKGMLAIRRQDWQDAHAVFSAYVTDNPDDEIAPMYLARIARVRQLEEAEARRTPPQRLAPITISRVDDEALRRLLLGFESIGEDCEFGGVQRRYGAEPLGLLRWNDVTLASLTAALEMGFEGMGDPAETELATGEIGEIYVRDRRWDLGMHTFLFTHEVSQDALLPKMCRRVGYLRDKFLADLREADKIFVYKSDAILFDELARLHSLLKTYGPIRLLHVRTVPTLESSPTTDTRWPQGDAGEIIALAPDLHVGYLSRCGDLHDIAFDDWVDICRAVAPAVATRALL